MCNFNKQNKETKEFIHLFMKKAAENVGGINYLLALIEAIKANKPNALTLGVKQVASNNTIIRWNKVIFKDKVDLIEKILAMHRNSEDPDFNILTIENTKMKKNIMNAICALSPVEFVVTPQNKNDGSGFSFKIFDTIAKENVKLNPIFIAIFFCSAEFTKKALKYN